MSTVELRFSALPSHVRTARLVAAAVARRAGVDESVLDEVRLAVGEACSRAVGLHRRSRPDEPVTVTLIQEAGRFSIEVADCVAAADDFEAVGLDAAGLDATRPDAAGLDPAPTELDGVSRLGGTAAQGPVPALTRDAVVADEEDQFGYESADLHSGSMGLAVISGLVDDLDVRSSATGAVIRMSWPAGGESGPGTGPGSGPGTRDRPDQG